MFSSSAYSEGNLYIGTVPLTVSPNVNLNLPFQIALSGKSVASLAASLKARGVGSELNGGTLKVSLASYPHLILNSLPTYLESSFVIDFTEPIVQKIKTSLKKKPTPNDLAQFTYTFIAKKSYSRAYDIASRVAKSKEGDCTEHAVFLTSLLRMFGFPAVVVHGLKILDQPSGTVGFYHAWVEYFADGKWAGIDGTDPYTPVNQRWLPLDILTNETIDFSFDALRWVTKIEFSKIEISKLPVGTGSADSSQEHR